MKSYPRGVTTNSDGGIESYEPYYPVFEAMQEVGMVLNLHGEIPSNPSTVSNSIYPIELEFKDTFSVCEEHMRTERRAPVLAPFDLTSRTISETSYRVRACYYAGGGGCGKVVGRYGWLYHNSASSLSYGRRLGGTRLPFL